MQSYIFDCDPIGREIAQAWSRLSGAACRCACSSCHRQQITPSADHSYAGARQRAAAHDQPLGVMRMPYANLRSHREILVVDGHVGFTGGMNIRAAFVTALAGNAANGIPASAWKSGGGATDGGFAHDWNFTTRESWKARPGSAGSRTRAGLGADALRGLGAGQRPGQHAQDAAGRAGGGAAPCADPIPYFLPDQTLIGALGTAARRGIGSIS